MDLAVGKDDERQLARMAVLPGHEGECGNHDLIAARRCGNAIRAPRRWSCEPNLVNERQVPQFLPPQQLVYLPGEFGVSMAKGFLEGTEPGGQVIGLRER